MKTLEAIFKNLLYCSFNTNFGNTIYSFTLLLVFMYNIYYEFLKNCLKEKMSKQVEKNIEKKNSWF